MSDELYFTFWGTTTLFSTAAAILDSPTSKAQGFQFLRILANTWFLDFFDYGYPSGCEVMSPCGSDLRLPHQPSSCFLEWQRWVRLKFLHPHDPAETEHLFPMRPSRDLGTEACWPSSGSCLWMQGFDRTGQRLKSPSRGGGKGSAPPGRHQGRAVETGPPTCLLPSWPCWDYRLSDAFCKGGDPGTVPSLHPLPPFPNTVFKAPVVTSCLWGGWQSQL